MTEFKLILRLWLHSWNRPNSLKKMKNTMSRTGSVLRMLENEKTCGIPPMRSKTRGKKASPIYEKTSELPAALSAGTRRVRGIPGEVEEHMNTVEQSSTRWGGPRRRFGGMI